MNALTVFPSNENPDCVCFVSVQACSYADVMMCDDNQCILSLDVLFCFFSTISRKHHKIVCFVQYEIFCKKHIAGNVCAALYFAAFLKCYIWLEFHNNQYCKFRCALVR